jgi:hypothetical protein
MSLKCGRMSNFPVPAETGANDPFPPRPVNRSSLMTARTDIRLIQMHLHMWVRKEVEEATEKGKQI